MSYSSKIYKAIKNTCITRFRFAELLVVAGVFFTTKAAFVNRTEKIVDSNAGEVEVVKVGFYNAKRKGTLSVDATASSSYYGNRVPTEICVAGLLKDVKDKDRVLYVNNDLNDPPQMVYHSI